MPSVPEKMQSYAELGVVQEDIESGLVYGTTFVKREGHNGRGVLLVHGQSGNRYGLSMLASELALAGYFCLSIDLPSHYKNPNTLRIGTLSETIMEAVVLLEQRYGLRDIGVVGHSLGAVGSIFASAGYTNTVEESLYSIGDRFAALLEQQNSLLAADGVDAVQLEHINTDIDAAYMDLKELLFNAMKGGLVMKLNVRCYVMLSPPRKVKAAYPGTSLLRKLNPATLKRIAEFLFHKQAVEVALKEGNLVKYEPERDPAYVNMQFFKTKEIYSFLEYIVQVKEPVDFLDLIERITALKRKEGRTNLMQYYYEKYIGGAPKLFIYGKYDLLLRPFMPFERGRLEQMYRSCGNAKVVFANLAHVMVENPKEQFASVAVRNEKVISITKTFLDKYLRPRDGLADFLGTR